ncbi:MAG: hypothetical protein HY236_15970, partial [Acidobacteria bacterium]|nr:hypothetical protein [Acidobacteriota bacterium]
DMDRILSLTGPDWRQESAIGLACLLDVGVYMGCQLLRDSDAVSMASSLELRVPLVDLRVAEFSRSCPDSLKLRSDGGPGPEYGQSGAKRVLIDALRDILPPGFTSRPKKGFALPHDHWAQHELAPLVEETCSHRAVAARGLLEADAIRELASKHSNGRGWSAWPHAWSLMILELWCRSALDGTTARANQALEAHAFR